MDPADPFTLLGLEPRFDLDPAAIARAYLAAVARLHPDLAGGDPDAPARSAAVNRARAILEDPERRAGALLQRLGGPAKEADRSLPPGFLMEIMETREEIEAAIASRSAAEVSRWRSWADAQRLIYQKRIAGLFAAGAGPQTLTAIRTQLNAWRYIERLIEQLDPDYDPQRADFDAEASA
jgi:DnaJ-domain-containing protein 1